MLLLTEVIVVKVDLNSIYRGAIEAREGQLLCQCRWLPTRAR